MSRSPAGTAPRTDDLGTSPVSRKTPYLTSVLQCDAPLAASARHELSNLRAVIIGRGKERSCERSVGGTATLRLQLADSKVSLTHAKLQYVSGRWILEDSKSRNGTILNGARIDRAVLKDQDVFEVGYTFFVYHVDRTPAEGAAGDVDEAQIRREPPSLSTFSPALSADFDALAELTHAPVSVLIEGDTGTGKELVARAMHSRSARSGPFIAVNCGAIPESLFESELFGYRKGAFSAASQDRSGVIREADKGTLFLDEIGELPLASQVKLLRVLQEQEVLPLGAARPIPVDIKFCAATNRKLRDQVERKQFRDDLFARISAFQLQLPPLRHRRQDLGLLIRTILGRLLGERARSVHFSRAAAAAMFQYHWPLNIRELESCLTTAFTLVKGDLIGIEHLPEKIRASINPLPPPGKLTVPSEEDEHFNLLREKLVALMISHDGNISAVARALGRDRVQVRRWLRKLNLEPARFRSA